jgi:serine/threonine protein kinase
MHLAKPRDAAYFRAAARLVRRLHAANVIHNDLAKETNWLVTPDGRPALVDFQLAMTLRHGRTRKESRRGPLARALGHDDIRHLLKHKRSYLPERLTAREQRILATPSLPSRMWMASGKKVYLFVTRRILHWRDREGAGDRGMNA